jgi:hypothetical protein
MNELVSVGLSGSWFCNSSTKRLRKSVLSSAVELDVLLVVLAVLVEAVDELIVETLMANLDCSPDRDARLSEPLRCSEEINGVWY